MKRAYLLAAASAALALSASVAAHATTAPYSGETGLNGFFGDNSITSSTFTDTFNFYFPSGSYDSSLTVSINSIGGLGLTIDSASFAGNALSVAELESVGGQTLSDITLTSPEQLVVTGTYSGSRPSGATYNGNLSLSGVSAAPEPSTWMLMIAGVAMVGGALRYGRRNGWTASVA